MPKFLSFSSLLSNEILCLAKYLTGIFFPYIFQNDLCYWIIYLLWEKSILMGFSPLLSCGSKFFVVL